MSVYINYDFFFLFFHIDNLMVESIICISDCHQRHSKTDASLISSSLSKCADAFVFRHFILNITLCLSGEHLLV